MATVLDTPARRPAAAPSRLIPTLSAAAGVVGVAIVFLGGYLLGPYFRPAPPKPDAGKIGLPDLDVEPWRALPVQDGRTKPLQTFAEEAVRQITGRTRFEKLDPLRVVLDWWLTRGSPPGPTFTPWRSTAFILCDHHGLRERIFADRLDAKLSPEDIEEFKHGKYVSPDDLAASAGFKQLLLEAERIREEDREKAQQYLSPEQSKAEEVMGRLVLFERICQTGGSVLGMRRSVADPLHLVMLDRVTGSAWFSLGELRQAQEQPDSWLGLLDQRVREFPQLYINPDRRQQLAAFQAEVKAGRGIAAIDALADETRASRAAAIAEFKTRHPEAAFDLRDARDPLFAAMTSKQRERLVAEVRQRGKDDSGVSVADMVAALETTFRASDAAALDDLRGQVTAASAKGVVYLPDDPRFRMLHLGYLEFRYPDLYRDAVTWQQFPADQAKAVLGAFEAVQQAYAGKGDFAAAGDAFRKTLKATSETTLVDGLARSPVPTVREAAEVARPAAQAGDLPSVAPKLAPALAAAGYEFNHVSYPGVTTIPLELQLGRVQPFQKAWILMLPTLMLFVASNVFRRAGWLYAVGFLLFAAALGYQAYGFYARVAISGRPPVTNMYETVVWVGFVCAVVAGALELWTRSRVFAIGGTLVATVCLILADQLPVALDPKISPLVPVLRSQFWLTIHVLTIVSAYAPAALAWGLGNIALGLLAFRTPRADTLKTLSQYTYRGMQMAVLLLAAGTFLGGWWAAYSWGRFWGWDPKETWALIALITYVVPLHARYIGWVRDFGLAVSGVLCFAAVVFCWYGVNFVLGAGLHSYGFGGGGPYWVGLAALLNVEWVLVASVLYQRRLQTATGLLAA